MNFHYQRTKNGWWADFTWRYDSGLVVGAVNNLADALALTADQQSTIGLYCGDERATLAHRITTCNSPATARSGSTSSLLGLRTTTTIRPEPSLVTY